ncbi:hypothetical protein BZA77DRAFT_292012 [Pyronema omphalodes]|nr:hypothetical protein BZA77DRAFT_292012 [Pyronema omphalodes]
MGCCGGSRKPEIVIAEHKFAYVVSALCLCVCIITVLFFSYFWIYMGTLISIACYAADIYSAIILLAFNRWTNDTLEKASLIDFDIAKIIFSACIFISFILLAIDWYFAIKIIKSDGVAEAYMNVIALRYNCIWGGKGKGDTGWKRFLVFSRLTSQRGMVDYIALFTYFAFKGWVRILFAEGPRVVINALVFISVTKADVIVTSSNQGALAGFDKFGKNVQHLYNENKMQVMILGTMAFTSLMWILAILRLLIAGIVYLCYLWHAMSGKQSLRKYCKDRIDTRMGEIVQKKHDKALKKEKEQRKGLGLLERQPTIPVLANLDGPGSHTETKQRPVLRYSADSQGSQTNLIPHATATPPPTYAPTREPTLPIISEDPRRNRPLPPSRTATTRTNASSTTQGSRGQNEYFDSRQQEPFSVIGGGGGGGMGGAPTRYQSQSSQQGDAYQMQPLAPARGNRYAPGMPQGRFPVAPREPPPAAIAGYTGGPRSQTAGPTAGPYGVQRNNTSAFGPPPRANTAGPTMGGYAPPPPSRSATTTPGAGGAGAGSYGPPPRINTATPGAGPYGAPRDDFYSGGNSNVTPVSAAYSTQEDDYYNHNYNYNHNAASTETPDVGPYGRPKRTNTFGDEDGYSGYDVSGLNTSAPMAPPRAATTNPFRSQTTDPQTINPRYAPPVRSQTTGPTTAAYGPPPALQEPTRTNTPIAPRILTPGQQQEDEASYYTASPSSYYTNNTTPITGTILPAPRGVISRGVEVETATATATNTQEQEQEQQSGYMRNDSEESSFQHGAGRGVYTAGTGGGVYAKQTYQPSRAKGDRVLPDDGNHGLTTGLGAGRSAGTGGADGYTGNAGGGLSTELDEFGPPRIRRAVTTPAPGTVDMMTASAAVAAADGERRAVLDDGYAADHSYQSGREMR